jgi:hypothetical protein
MCLLWGYGYQVQVQRKSKKHRCFGDSRTNSEGYNTVSEGCFDRPVGPVLTCSLFMKGKANEIGFMLFVPDRA